MRHDEDLDQLVNEVMEGDLVLQAIVGEAEMLIFPSSILPEHYKKFQGKQYLWGVFRPREDRGVVAAEPLNGLVLYGQAEAKEKQQVSNRRDVVECEEPNCEMVLTNSGMPLDNLRLVDSHPDLVNQGLQASARGGTDRPVYCKSPAQITPKIAASGAPDPSNMGFQLNASGERQKGDTSPQMVEATAVAANAAAPATITAPIPPEASAIDIAAAAAMRANHGQINSELGVPLDSMFCFVAGRTTPRLEQIIQKLEREGSLVVAMRGEVITAGPGLGNITATMQQ